MTTRWLSATQQQHWRSLLTGTTALFAALNRDLEETVGMGTGEYEVLVRLSEAPDRTMRMSALADDLVHSRSRITHTVGRMERLGLVERVAAPQDRRGVSCVMTEQGQRALEKAAPVHVESVRTRLIDIATPDEVAAMGAAFARIAATIEDEDR